MQKVKKHLHVIGIGGIGVSALARYYKHLGYTISGSDGADSPFLDTLRSEGIDISIGHERAHLPDHTDLVIYSEAIITKPDLIPEEQIYANPELAKARDLGIEHLSYPVALGRVFDAKQGIAITGSHGKSTTTAMTGVVLSTSPEPSPLGEGVGAISPSLKERGAGGEVGASVLVGTQVPQLGNSNFHFEDSPNFVIEACEYKRSFLHYHPYITVITNIDLDHLDYYKNLDDYISAFQSIVDQTSGYVVISSDDENSQKLDIPLEKKIIVGCPHPPSLKGEGEGGFIPDKQKQNPSALSGTSPSQGSRITYFPRVEEMCCNAKKCYTVEKSLEIPKMSLQVPGEHLLHDAHLAYAVGRLLGMQDDTIVAKLESYRGSWRRSEIVGTTDRGNILISDYGHHPSEIRPTLRAIREKYSDKKLFVIFQPHQYSRTRELLREFAISFSDADELIIPNIYFSRDKKEDVEWMTVERFIETLQKTEDGRQKTERKIVTNGNGLENTAKLIREYDMSHPDSSVILLLGAGDIDTLRYEISGLRKEE